MCKVLQDKRDIIILIVIIIIILIIIVQQCETQLVEMRRLWQ
jgi:hypothetical protein